MKDKPRVIIIGAGFTGTATAYDLSVRGFDVIVIERGEIASGTSGRTHGLLHSGARYCVNDQASARECIEENFILRKIAKQCIEPNGGYFVAINDSDMEYAKLFVKGAEECDIPLEEFNGKQLREMEPAVSSKIIKAYSVPDGSFEPIRLAWAFCSGAAANGAKFLTYHEVEGLLVDGKGAICGAKVWKRNTDERFEIKSDIVINATGAWAGKIAEFAGLKVGIKPTPGIMVAVEQRFTQTVINRLNKPGDGDIVIPQRRMAVIGTTSFEATNVDFIPVDQGQAQEMIDRGAEMIPGIKTAKRRGVYMSSRPLIDEGVDARSLTRTFKTLDHEKLQNIPGIISIIGGKATTSRVMAEKVSDLVCDKLGVSAECETRERVLPSYRQFLKHS